MFVSVGGGNSEVKSVRSGVPQGSVLGPLLFLIYANFLASGLSSKWYAYADDFKLYCARDIGRGNSSDELQEDLNVLSSRSASWNLKVNPGKCVVIRFGHRGAGTQESTPSGYVLDGRMLTFTKSHRDLGVTVDSLLKFHEHVGIITRKAASLVNQLLRGTVCREPAFMLRLFVSHIRPLMDFASCLWNVGFLGDGHKLESVQRRWTREVSAMSGLNYQNRLKSLGLFSMRGRLLRSDLIKMWKAFHPIVDVGLVQLFERQSHGSTRSHGYKLSIPRCYSDVRRRFWSVRCVNIWNGLPADVVQADTVDTFKCRLDKYMGEKFYEVIGG